jgi:hypothetical protein
MIGAICLIGVGAFAALYFSHNTFRDRVNDLCLHVKELFVPAEPATDKGTSATPAVAPVPETVTPQK